MFSLKIFFSCLVLDVPQPAKNLSYFFSWALVGEPGACCTCFSWVFCLPYSPEGNTGSRGASVNHLCVFHMQAAQCVIINWHSKLTCLDIHELHLKPPAKAWSVKLGQSSLGYCSPFHHLRNQGWQLLCASPAHQPCVYCTFMDWGWYLLLDKENSSISVLDEMFWLRGTLIPSSGWLVHSALSNILTSGS